MISAQFNPHQVVQSHMGPFKERFEKALVLVLNQMGMELVAFARTMHNYVDRTGNLTNSMGYVVVKGLTPVMQGGELSDGEGAESARRLCSQLASNGGTTYSLWIVAGMNYAAYVEAKGYNVLVPAELKAKSEFRVRMDALLKKFDQKLRDSMQ